MHLPQHCYYAKVLHKALFPTLNSMKQKTENAKCAFKVRTPPVTLKHQIFFLSFFYHSHVDIFNPFSGKTHKSAQAKMRLLYPDLKEDTSVDLL